MTNLYETRQDSFTALGDGNVPPLPLLRMGLQPFADKWDLFALQGRMFMAKQATIGTAIAGSAANNAGIVLTAPTIRFTVPTGTTVFPHRFQVGLLLGGTSVDNEIAVIYSQTDSYSSDGTAYTPLNMRTDAPRATSVLYPRYAAASAIVEGSLTNVRALHQACYPLDMVFGTSYNSDLALDLRWDDLHPIVGPASFLIYLSAKTAANTHYFSLEWAEVPTENAVSAV